MLLFNLPKRILAKILKTVPYRTNEGHDSATLCIRPFHEKKDISKNRKFVLHAWYSTESAQKSGSKFTSPLWVHVDAAIRTCLWTPKPSAVDLSFPTDRAAEEVGELGFEAEVAETRKQVCKFMNFRPGGKNACQLSWISECSKALRTPSAPEIVYANEQGIFGSTYSRHQDT